MCRILRVARSGFYAWIRKPFSDRAIEDERLLRLIRSSYVATGKVYSGLVGGDFRREHMLMGAPVNTAARLMGLLRDRSALGSCPG